ncbi:molybdopterin-dependent oxidoreductase [Campylobacter sp. RM12327]|uniref:DMSO/selenate family reductase complex A subunit n=1 Tax=Campylobacter sputorum TaxID=206 RepID=UPI000B78B08C|nr:MULTISPECIES: DMSO/selenate family reductase complex A subunit [Campylobacter]ASM40835.1 dimethyl sulfoxide reductase, subunit A [Campylobacter sputorum]MBE7357857.1 molybdopterin-dependent oxidoreductase [Campylobacter sp. RM11302]MBF6669716.1 molybdopterin-dependent oxidoreductase [Campylobacter sp. RM12327]MBF6674859.1 molybdopterin-dependent oxidoreductase [Campylobacter sp. RM13538]MBF6675703.1 molybdopterin-dependent oxidoreductase [Campylobacter sp. RM12321]
MRVNRRNFLKLSGLTGAYVMSASANELNPLKNDEEKTFIGGCPVNCGSKCMLKAHVKDGIITHMTTDDDGDDTYENRQIRACIRGRSTRYRYYNPNRLLYPLKRVGKRGEGKFERISWDEAINTIASKMKEVKEKYGNEALYILYHTGTIGSTMAGWLDGSYHRLLSFFGGYLNYHNSYSTAQIANGLTCFYGTSAGSDIENLAHAKLAVLFGSNHAETRMGGSSIGYSLQQMREKNSTRIICIDPQYNDTMIGNSDEWIPIAPGTDAALIAGMAYVMIKENLYDKEFLDKYCIGFSKETLPEDAPENSSYMDYILGTGYDKTPKTPEWAERITRIPTSRIIKLAREIASTKPCFIEQGWGPQRHANGEQSSRAIATLACMTGNVGILGGNTGGRGGSSWNFDTTPLPFNNPVKTSIPCFLWYEGVRLGEKMTALEHGVRNADHLKAPIKIIFNLGGNCLTNQHADIQTTSKILEDESLCELIIDVNITRTHSNSYADIILPSALSFEYNDIVRVTMGDCSTRPYAIFAQKAIEPLGETKTPYEICTLLANKLGGREFEAQFTEKRTWDEWLEWLWNDTTKKYSFLPSYNEIKTKGFWKIDKPVKPRIALENFIKDPKSNPLNTPTGKIEIYSTKLAEMKKTWKLLPGQQIEPVPVFEDVLMGPRDPMREKYPIQFYGYHYKGRTHSSFWDSPAIRELNPQEILISKFDAKNRDIKTGDKVIVENHIGKISGIAKVTSRVIPGAALTYQGGWAKFENGIDVGGCINTLTSDQPTAIAKGNGVHSVLVEIRKA